MIGGSPGKAKMRTITIPDYKSGGEYLPNIGCLMCKFAYVSYLSVWCNLLSQYTSPWQQCEDWIKRTSSRDVNIKIERKKQ